MKRVLSILPALVLVLAFALTACGGDTGSSCSGTVCNVVVGDGYDSGAGSATGVNTQFPGSAQAFHVVGKLNGVSDGTVVTGVLTGIDSSGTETQLGSTDLTISGGANVLHFTWTNKSGSAWPSGKYRTDIKVSGTTQGSVTWSVQ